MKTFKRLIILTMILGSQVWAFNPQTFRLSYSFDYITAEDALHSKYTLLGDDNPWMFGTSYNYQDDPIIKVNSSATAFISSLVEKYHSFDFVMARAMSLGDKKAVLGVRANYNHIHVNSKGTSALGDTNISLKVQLSETEDSAFALTTFMDIPTGDRLNFTSDDSIGLGILGSYEKHWDSFHLVANLGFRHAKNAIISNVDLSNKIITNLAGTLDFTEKISAISELRAEFGTPFAEDQNPYEITAAIKYKSSDRLNTFLGVGFGGFDFDNSNVNTSSGDFRLFFGLKWIPETRKETIVEEVITTVEKEKIQNLLHVLKHIRFHVDTAKLTKRSKKILKFVAKVIKKHKEKIRMIYIQGHTDTTGTREYNKDLSQRRAASVAKFLGQQDGVNESLFIPQGFGEERTIVKEKTKKDRAINRRVEFNIIYH